MYRPVFYLEHDGLEAGFCSQLQVEPPQVDPTNRASLSPHLSLGPETETSSIYCAHLKTETVSSLRDVALNKRQDEG
jgi:hypothetical protein